MSVCLYLWVFVGIYVCIYTMCVSGTCGGQKRELDLLKLELLIVVSYHVSSED